MEAGLPEILHKSPWVLLESADSLESAEELIVLLERAVESDAMIYCTKIDSKTL